MSLSGGSPWADATINRLVPGYKPEFGPGSWNWYDAFGKQVGPNSIPIQYALASKLIDKMGSFGNIGAGIGAGALGGIGPVGFTFSDAAGRPIGGVNQASGWAGINPPAAWNPALAASSSGALMGAARTPSILAAPAGAPPTVGNYSMDLGDASRAAALRSAGGLNMAGLGAQAGLDFSTQQAQANAMRAAQGLQTGMYGLGANEQLLAGSLANQQHRSDLSNLARLFGLLGGGRSGTGGSYSLQSLPAGWHPFGAYGTQAMTPLF